ncbi:hypothetical protein OA92_09105 [Marinomonas sp. SBI22]|uniref:DUF4856 domain-containing protein n=1 Tax=unclassified Marinomonas TaxID=196814 RepID=UPI0007AFC5CA|nr:MULTISPECIES: DUF4856 domain-containing protein [unclassified Marinomonas]KZM42948.1 hypothetical protein OA92_09105 [Marinomonas sp. SBI22]KZM44518.1 hypothetical protein OA91_08530 [Marinomonas sp. SBI8L]
MSFKPFALATLVTSIGSSAVFAGEVYNEFPVTVAGYQGSATSSVSYSGQAARHVIHNSLKKTISKGQGKQDADQAAKLALYFEAKDADRAILDPVSKEGFAIKQTTVGEISKGKNLSSKAYKGAVTAWPGNMTGQEVLEDMIAKAAKVKGGFDPVNGYDYTQLISKFTMGAVFYNQAVDGYLDEKLNNSKKTNDKAYKEGAAYSAKEHYWDEAFGYFGAPAHALTLDAKSLYGIAKKDPKYFSAADYNKDGVVDLKTEMVYAHAYYAAGSDKSGKTNYLNNIVSAFYDGRALIHDAQGTKLDQAQMAKLNDYVNTIRVNWQQVIAEAAFKYAGSVYKDLDKLSVIQEANGDVTKAYRAYAKHWGELKGFAMALQVGGEDLGETAVKLNRLTGFSPVLLGDTQVIARNVKGEFVQSSSISMEEYKLHMMKIQLLLAERFNLKARSNDVLAGMDELAAKLSSSTSIEND